MDLFADVRGTQESPHEHGKGFASLGKQKRASSAGQETQGYIDRIRGMLLVPGSGGRQDTLTHVKALMAERRQAQSPHDERLPVGQLPQDHNATESSG